MTGKIIREKLHHLPTDHYCGIIWGSFTICVQHRQLLFESHSIVNRFVSILDSVRQLHACLVLLYCFMPDHLHLILQGEDELSDLYATILDFKQKAGIYLWRSRSPCRWQKNFYDHLIRSDTELASQLTYVAENPVRRGLVSRWQDYRFTGSLGIELASVLDAML